MNKLRLILCTSLLSASLGLSAAEIFKWTDEDGNVHYGDRPTGAVAGQDQYETVPIASRRTDAAQVNAGVEARQERDAARAEARDAAAKAEEEAADARAEAEERSKMCEQSRARLEKFVRSRRLYRVDDSGERTYLDEAQMQDARAKMQERVEEYCSPQG